jgi:hypothetical protein
LRLLSFLPLVDQQKAVNALRIAKKLEVGPQGLRSIGPESWTRILSWQLAGLGITKVYVDHQENFPNIVKQINKTKGQPTGEGFTVIDLGDAQNLPAFLAHPLAPLEDAVQVMSGFSTEIRQCVFANLSVKPRRVGLFLHIAQSKLEKMAVELMPLLDEAEKIAAVKGIILSLSTLFGYQQDLGDLYIALLEAFGVLEQEEVKGAILAFRKRATAFADGHSFLQQMGCGHGAETVIVERKP